MVYTFFKNFNRNVKLYESTEKFPNRAMYYLLTLGGQATANFCRCTFQLISIYIDLRNKKVPQFTCITFTFYKAGVCFQKE